jgi:HEAT repeat protein
VTGHPYRYAAATTLFLGLLLGQNCGQSIAQRDLHRNFSEWKEDLEGDDLPARRAAAIATRSADRRQQQLLLPILNNLLMTEKDGQVRLAVLDTVTDLGPAASSSVPALMHSMQNEFGGNYNEKRHQHFRVALALAAIGKPAVRGLRGLLTAEKQNVRAEAAMAIGRIGSDASSAVPDLIAMFADEELRVRTDVARALGGFGEPALEPLLKAAKDQRDSFRVGAIEALGVFQTPDRRATQSILDAARDNRSPQVRVAAIRSIVAYNVSDKVRLEVMLENLRHDDKSVRTAVVDFLAQETRLIRQIESELFDLLLSESDGIAWHAAFLLQKIGPGAAPGLLAALSKDDSRIEQVAQALGLMGRPIVELIFRALEHPDPRVRQGAALALGQVRPLPDDSAIILAAGMDDPDRQVQAAFLTSIGHLGSRGRAAVPAVRRKLNDPSPVIREMAIGILFEAAQRDDQLIDDLTAMIDDKEPAVQRQAIETIRATGPLGQRALPAVINQLGNPDNEVRLAAASMIGSHGRAATEAVPALAALLENRNTELRVVVAQTLSQLGDAARPALEKLVPLLEHENVELRVAVVKTIGNLELPAKQLRPWLAKAVHDSESDVSRQAFRGIQRLGRSGNIFLPDLILLAAEDAESRSLKRVLQQFEKTTTDPASVPELMERLQHDSEAVKLLAIRFLGLAGVAGKDAIPALTDMLENTSSAIAEEAAAALDLIRSEASRI